MTVFKIPSHSIGKSWAKHIAAEQAHALGKKVVVAKLDTDGNMQLLPFIPAKDRAIDALEYACTIEGDARRGVWLKAFVEEKPWAIGDFSLWLERRDAEK